MDNAGRFDLATLQISAAVPQSLLTPIADLNGMTAVTLDVDFKYGAGGSTVSVIVATSFDLGTTWRHIARFDFTTASAVKQCNLEGLLSKAVSAYADLASEGVNDGILGNMLAAIVTTTGTYTATTLSVRASVR
ncbi:MAG: hypothetical protein JWP25_8837 [Bradyrhizobium sp.]|nr:hypothetical protein [Bradyrhizobium sp.]